MEWLILILWLSIINGALVGQYVLNWMGNQPRFVGDKLYKYIKDIITSDFKSEVIAKNGTENHIHILLKQNP